MADLDVALAHGVVVLALARRATANPRTRALALAFALGRAARGSGVPLDTLFDVARETDAAGPSSTRH